MLACLQVEILSITSKYGGENDHLPSVHCPRPALPLSYFHLSEKGLYSRSIISNKSLFQGISESEILVEHFILSIELSCSFVFTNTCIQASYKKDVAREITEKLDKNQCLYFVIAGDGALGNIATS